MNAGNVLGSTSDKEALVINSGGAVTNTTLGSRVTIQNLLIMAGGTLTGSGNGDANGAYSFNNGAAGIDATSDAAGNPAVISAAISPENTNLTFTVTRGPAAPPSDLNVTSPIVAYSTSGYGIIENGNGVMTLSNTSTFSGATTINGGTLQLGDGTAKNGSVAGGITDNAALVFANPNPQIYNGIIGGSGSLCKLAAGMLTLTQCNTYSGGTIVDGGTLNLDAGGGTGAICGIVTINRGGTVKLSTTDALGYSTSANVTAVNINWAVIDNASTGGNGYATNFSLTGGSMSSTGGGTYSFTNGYGIATFASTATSLITRGHYSPRFKQPGLQRRRGDNRQRDRSQRIGDDRGNGRHYQGRPGPDGPERDQQLHRDDDC